MPYELEYVVKDAIMMCDKGAKPAKFIATENTKTRIGGLLVANENDVKPIINIPSFGPCSVKGTRTPVPVKWLDTYPAKVQGGESLLFRCKLPCGAGGKIEFVTSGQIPVSPEQMEAIMDEHAPEEPADEGGWGWWDTAELIPVVGDVIGMVRSARSGSRGIFALNAAFLVVGLVSFGVFLQLAALLFIIAPHLAMRYGNGAHISKLRP